MSTAPLTQISASRGISSSGNATLEFFLADPSSDDSPAGQGLQQGADGLAQQWHAGSSDYQELQAEAGQAINARQTPLADCFGMLSEVQTPGSQTCRAAGARVLKGHSILHSRLSPPSWWDP